MPWSSLCTGRGRASAPGVSTHGRVAYGAMRSAVHSNARGAPTVATRSGLTTTAQWSSSYATTSFGVSAGYGSKTCVSLLRTR